MCGGNHFGPHFILLLLPLPVHLIMPPPLTTYVDIYWKETKQGGHELFLRQG